MLYENAILDKCAKDPIVGPLDDDGPRETEFGPPSEETSLEEGFEKMREEMIPIPFPQARALSIFVNDGIDTYYRYHGHVPETFDDYLRSGIPMLIPNDITTSNPYRLVDEIDLNDTTGFTFSSDGMDTCEFNFVVWNRKTEQNQILTVKPELPPSFYPTRSDHVPDFDNLKRTFTFLFFTEASFYYFGTNDGSPPQDLYDMLKDAGTLIEDGWRWFPDPTNNLYFEFGYDAENRLRHYLIQGSTKQEPNSTYRITVQDIPLKRHLNPTTMYDLIDAHAEDIWTFQSNEYIPPDIIVFNKFVSLDTMYESYLDLVAKGIPSI